MRLLRPLEAFGTVCAAVLLSAPLLAQTPATGDPRTISEPQYPDVCKVLQAQFSNSQRATPPATDDTSRLQVALDSCAGTGKSVMLIRGGTNDAFFTQTLAVDGEALVVKPGITLFGNNGYAGELLNVSGTNPAIMGPGTIDGRGDLISGTPRLIEARNTQNFIVYDVTLQHAAKMHLYVEGGSNLTVWNLTVATPANTKNTDGIDIDSMTNATVYGSSIEDGDDGVAVKTNSGPASNITVRNNDFYGTHGMSIGSQTMYGVTNVLWDNNRVYGTDMFGNVATDNNGIRIKSDQTCGGLVQQVTYRATQLIGVKHLLIFNPYYGTCSGNPGIPVFQDILVDGLTAVNSQSGAYSQFEGFDANNLLELYLANVNLDQTAQKNTQNATVGLDNSNITPAGPGVTTFNF